MSKDNPRLQAVQSVYRCTHNNAFSNIEIGNTLKSSNFDKRDAALYTLLTHGVLERLPILDSFIDELSSDGINTVDDKTKAVLRVGIYQLLFTEKIPVSAASNEAVNATKSLRLRSAGFVNAIMRRAAREADQFKRDMDLLPAPVKFCVSEYVYDIVSSQYPERFENIFCATFKRSAIPLRVNTLKTSVDELKTELQGASRTQNSPFGLLCKGMGSGELYEKLDGRAFIQGEGSQFAIDLLDAKPGQTVVDVCACPGGKSFSAAIEMQNTGKVFAFDLHANKLGLIKSGAEKLGIDIIEARQNDARFAVDELIGEADRVICDVPCSGLGEINTKPEIRYKERKDFERLPDIQLKILTESSKYLKSGGVLVYSTCTINKNENENVVKRFIEQNENFSIVSSRTFLFDTDGEGFFACKIKYEK